MSALAAHGSARKKAQLTLLEARKHRAKGQAKPHFGESAPTEPARLGKAQAENSSWALISWLNFCSARLEQKKPAFKKPDQSTSSKFQLVSRLGSTRWHTLGHVLFQQKGHHVYIKPIIFESKIERKKWHIFQSSKSLKI